MSDYVLHAETGLLGTLLTQPAPESQQVPPEPEPLKDTELAQE